MLRQCPRGKYVNRPFWSESEKAQFVNEGGWLHEADEWASLGFSISEAIEWTLWAIEPKQAKIYRKRGILNPPHPAFFYSGIEIMDAVRWEEKGFDVDLAEEWLGTGIEIMDAVRWVEKGFDVEAAGEWTDWGVDPETAERLRSEGFSVPPSDQFRDENVSLENALNWIKFGFEDIDAAWQWIEWKVAPKDAYQYRTDGLEPPDEEFRDEGLSFAQAMKWVSRGFSAATDNGTYFESEYYWKYWYDAQIKPSEAESLRATLSEFIEKEFRAGVRARRRRYSFSFRDEDEDYELQNFKSECLTTLSQLKIAGLKINPEAMIRWRGFSSEQILAAIDNEIDPDHAFALGKSLTSTRGVKIYSLLKSIGAEDDIEWVERNGFSVADIEALRKLKIDLHDFVMLTYLARLDAQVLLKWAKAKWPVTEKKPIWETKSIEYVVAKWIETGLDPKVAYQFFISDFSPEEAQAWVGVGVIDPKIAQRRKNAGLSPK